MYRLTTQRKAYFPSSGLRVHPTGSAVDIDLYTLDWHEGTVKQGP